MVTMREIDELRARIDAEIKAIRRIEKRAHEAEAAMQSAIDRCRAACGAGPSEKLSSGHDWIDELIGLLRVTRRQLDGAQRERDDINRRAGQWRETSRVQSILDALVSDEPDSKFDDEIVAWRKRVRETVERNRVPDRAIAERNELRVERNEWQKIAKHNKWALSVAIDRARRLAAAIRGALIALRARTPSEWIEATLQDALLTLDGDDSSPPNDSISRAEVKDMIERELTAHVSGRHVG